MGVIGNIIGAAGAIREAGEAVGGVAEVFVGNAAARDAAAEARIANALTQLEGEFASAGGRGFDRFVNALNRLPRPLMTIGTLGLFAYAMAEPIGFAARMEGLNLIPEPLWWLMGAIVSFYFGARELHHYRARPIVGTAAVVAKVAGVAKARQAAEEAAQPLLPQGATRAVDPDYNAAVEDWRKTAD